MAQRQTGARTLQQVLEQSSSLSQLTERLQMSQRCLKAVMPLIPAPMRKAIHAGPVEHQVTSANLPMQHTCWYILADNTAVAAKLRQLQPMLLQYLEKEGICVQEVKVQILPQTNPL